ncbi:DEAD/DEAH box helicase family protein [Faecalibacterium prausnitzii]|uniref:DEAD/DEAH box helicase family protein n=1 Tax=Faecalibacterium prausnitzii TaxID=853 RepID=UPI004037DF2D
MPSKTEEYLVLAQRTANGLTRYWESWTDYLTTASRLYKYPFADQLMIYAQRPDATACADFDIWNNRMNRYVRRGAKGIALLDESSGFPRLHYVFDVSDTGVRRNSRDPEVWQYNDDLKHPVSEMLAATYGISGERVSQQLADVAGKLVADYWDNNGGDIRAIVDGSLLMDYDEAGVEMQFKSAAAMSVTYTLLERCGFEPAGWFDKDDFQAIYNFSTPDAVFALGAAVSDMSREVLRNIERTVKTTIRRRNAERSQYEYEQQERDLLDHRGLSAPEPDPEPAPEAAEQVRQAAPGVPDEPSPGAVQHDAPEREPVPAPDGGGAERKEPDAADHGAASETEPGPGQGAESDGMGAAHEQPAGTGRGTGADGIDLQLSFFDAHIPTEAQQIEKIDQAESEKTPSAFVLSQAEIENELRKHGSGFAGGKQRIMALYQTQPDRNLRAKALAKEYGTGGHSHDFLDGSRGFVNHDGRGMEFDHYPEHKKFTLSWTQVERYIDLMIQSDRYLTDKEKEQRTARQEAECQLPMLDGTVAAEYTALKKQYPNTLVGFELNGNYLFYDKDAVAVERILRTNLLSQENVLGKVKVTGFPSEQWAAESKKLWAAGNNVYLAGLNENGSHHQTKYLREADYLPIGSIIKLDGRDFRVEHVNFTFKSVSLQDMELTKNRLPIFRNEHLPHIRELYEEQQAAAIDLVPEKEVSYKVGDEVVVDLPTRTIEGTVGYIGDTDVRIDTSAHGQSWDNEVINKRQFEDGLRQVEAQLSDEELDELPISAVMDGKVQTFPDATALDEALNAEPAPEPAGNFRITDDHLGEGGAKQKYARNIEAIRTLFKLEQEHRGATAEEQQVLSQYVGWGGLSDAFDPSKDNWAKEYAELKNLLSEDEYTAARSSTLNAHYTSPVVIRSIYEAVEKMGFKSGNILEPSMGVGNFFGMLPDTMADSRLYGVELDSITGRIAKKLYPQADITVAGFETTDRRDFYDLAIGNVPFGQYKVNDKAYNKLGFNIHNYFFAKAIDQVRPGGVIAFVTSRYTMDSKDSTARKHMAECADLLGAIRLPNNAFKANAGTEVVSDIIFLQKRDRPIDHEPDWVQLGKTEDGFAINQYFVDHPEMVLGELTTESTPYGHDLTVAPIEGAVLADQLAEAVQHIEGQYVEVEVETPDVADAEVERKTLPADPDVKNFSYAVVDGEVYYRENSIMTQVELSDNAKARVTGMVELRQIVNQLIQEQLDDYPDEDIKATQAKLNTAYDAFTAKYGLLNDRKNGRLFEDDSSYYLLCSLENLDENKQLKSKADMFTKRTIRPEHTVTSVDTPSEALAVSIGEHGRVDLPYMAELLGSPGDYERITTELQGVIFKDPSADADEPEAGWQTADEYLSGNVRNKLRMAQLAAESHPEFKINVEALTKAQPKDLEASEIDIRLGATWLNPAIVQQFMMETFQPPYRIRYNNLIQVRYSPFTSEWRIGNKSAAGMYDIMSTETYGTHRANAYKILEDTLNLRDCRIYDTIEEDGKERRVLNQKETMLAQQKQQAIKDTFAGWVWQDPQRRNLLVKQYNELFNSTRPREYDGSHIHFVGMNPEINLREHQRNAVAHVLYGGNTLLAHEVGAGKSFEMAASAMESKRLGLCQKSLFVVPNHLTEQWASEFLRLYPNAKLLVTSKKDFEPANRKRFCARIATGDYDAVIIGHSQFEKIPLSAERQARIIEDQIEEIEKAIAEAKEQSGEHFTVKQMEKTRKTLEVKLKKLQSTDRKDDVVTFEQLGVDRLFVDESQNYKNLYLYTKMRNVAGLSTSEAQKSSDMFGKCRYLDEVTGGRGVIFATGTPISNSMTEMYTLMRYLQYSTLQQKQLTHFDAWASTFGETTTAIELAPEGTGYRARTRFAKFFNLPELMNMFKEAADIKTSDQLHLPVPEAKFETVVVKPSEIQQDMVKSLSERAAEVHSGAVDPSVDNMLKITSDGRKIGLDQRLMNPLTPDDPDSKLNACVDNVLRIWNETKEDNLTQLIFCDMSTPKGDGSFNVYDDIRTKLLAAGVPESEVEFIHNADTEGKKADLFSKVRSGKVRVLLGSTAKMGAGTNVQTLLVAVHHLDVGWRPSDMTQRNGRIIRQGNKNKQVYVYNYVTEGTFDAYLWQTLENKQKFISQIMTSKSPMRSCDDVDEQALSYAEVKALCAGDPRIREKMDLDVQVAKLKVLRSDYQNQKYRLEDKLLKHYPEEIQKAKNRIAALKNDAQIADAHPQDKENFCGMTIKGMVFDEKKAAGERLMLACKEMPNADMMLLGTYRGFELNIRFDSFKNEHQIVLRGELSYPVPLGDDPRGNIVRLDNAIGNFADRIADAEAALDSLEQQKQAAEVEIAKPFAQEEELQTKSARLAELDALLNMEHQSSRTEPEAEEKPDARPSVLAALEEKADKVEPVRPFKSYLDKDGDAR